MNNIDTQLSDGRLGEIAWRFLFGTLPPKDFSSISPINPSNIPDPTSTEMRLWLSEKAKQFDVTFTDSDELSVLHSIAWEIVKKKFLTEGIHINATEVKAWHEEVGQMESWGMTPNEWGVFMWTLVQFVVQEYGAAVEKFIEDNKD
jgi:hypothetical protein